MHIDQPVAAKKLRSEMIPTDRFYARLVVLAALLDMIDPGCDWKRRLIDLISRYPCAATAPDGHSRRLDVAAFLAVPLRALTVLRASSTFAAP